MFEKNSSEAREHVVSVFKTVKKVVKPVICLRELAEIGKWKKMASSARRAVTRGATNLILKSEN